MTRKESEKQLSAGKGKWNPGEVLFELDAGGGSLEWTEVFPHRPNRPVEIEIGIGKGTFLLARARRHPQINLLGVEYARSYAIYSADRTRRAGLENVRVVPCDAGDLVANYVPSGSVLRVHIYFPDPWPKRKHHKRRLIQGPFVDHLHRVLQPGGQLLIVTDHRDYFEQIRRVLSDRPGLATISFPSMIEEDDTTIVGTNFERKYLREGRSFYRLARMKYA